MKQQFLDLTGLTELVAYIKSNVTDKKEILPYASNKLFPSTGDINAIYIDTATNIIYRWDESSKTYKILAQAVKSISISESTENGKITLTVDGVKTTVPIHGLKSAAFTESSAYSPADHTHTKAQIGLGSVDNTADKDKSVKHANTADSATAAGIATTATNVSGENATADAARHVWFSDSVTETKRNYNDKFKYNPTTNTVTANISGFAASANSVLWSGVTNKPSTFTPSAHNHDDSTITSLNASKLFGTIDIARLPQGALERLVIVEDDTARFKLTTANVQLGDTVKVNKTQKMYFVIDDSKLNSEAGYTVYTAGSATSVPWSGVTGRPSSYPPASHNHDERYYTETEMNSKLAEKAAKVHTHVKSEVGLGNVDNTADANKSVKYAASAGTATKANAVPWSGITDKPSTYSPSAHTHDDRYYTKSEINANVYRLKTFDVVPANADLNTYITPGTYGQSTGSTAQTIKNLPYSNSPYEFKLIVEYYFSNSSQYIMQRLYRWRSTEYYIRESTDSGVSWLAWKKFAKSDETLLLSGGTMTGTTNYTNNKLSIKFRPDHENYCTGIMYQTNGNEALVFANKNAVTSFIFKNGLDPNTMASDTWGKIVPSVQIKNQSLYINSLIGSNTTPSYNFYVEGTAKITGTITGNLSGNASSASSVPWSGVTGKPSTYTPSSHTHKMTDIPDWGSYIYDVHVSRTANTVLAAPNGSNGSATFRKLVAADIPSITKSKISDFPGSLPASDVYAWAKASTKPSYSWGEITGKPGTFTPAGHSHYSLTTIGDQRSIATSPNSYSNNLIFQGLKGNSTIGISNAGTYSYVLGLRGWNDSSGGNSHELAFNNSGIYTRNGATSWSTWKQLLDSSNYTSYTVTKSGSGASGTWSINVTGNAATATKLATARSINGTNFDGSGNITTATWGTARNITIGSTKKSVNGGADVSWSLGEIGAAAASHSHSYLPLSGGTMTGNIAYKGSKASTEIIKFINNASDAYGNGIAIGGGGLTIVGGGESSDIVSSIASNGGDERLILSNDGPIDIYTNCQEGLSKATHVTIDNSGLYSGTAAKANSVPWTGITGKPSTFAPAPHSHNKVSGAYTGNGGQQKPNYFGTNQVGFLMMNTTVNNNSHYKDWIIMDCYSGSDVGGAVAFGVNRQSLGAYIMRSESGRASWAESAELLHTSNYTSYTVTKTGSGASGTWGINISGKSASTNAINWVAGNEIRFTKPSYTSPQTLHFGWAWADNSKAKLISEYRFDGGDGQLTQVAASQFNGPLNGNANTATKLQTARTINGTSFNGSANITTANWGTARTITVGNTGKSVNGSGNVSWSLGEIGVHVSNKEPAASDGKNGDVWIVYEG